VPAQRQGAAKHPEPPASHSRGTPFPPWRLPGARGRPKQRWPPWWVLFFLAFLSVSRKGEFKSTTRGKQFVTKIPCRKLFTKTKKNPISNFPRFVYRIFGVSWQGSLKTRHKYSNKLFG
jgi:hypothetical protein